VFTLYLSSYIQRREQYEYDSKKPLFDEIIEWFEGDNNDDEDDFESGRIKPIILPPGVDQKGGSKEGSEAESENENVVKPFPPLSDGKTESNETTTDNVIKPFPAPGNGK